MKYYDDNFQLIKTITNAIFNPLLITKDQNKSETINSSENSKLNNNTSPEKEKGNKKSDKSVEKGGISKSYDDNKNATSYNNQKGTSSDPEGIIDSIAQELTSVRLKQAIILSEIVGKPKSKTRKRRRY